MKILFFGDLFKKYYREVILPVFNFVLYPLFSGGYTDHETGISHLSFEQIPEEAKMKRGPL